VLLRDRLFILSFLLIILLSTAVSAEFCSVDELRSQLRVVLYEYYEHPNSVSLELDKVVDMLTFYLSIQAGETSVDCSVAGALTGELIIDLLTESESAPQNIPTCTDSTEYGVCSTSKPNYCNNGALIPLCDTCGCNSGDICGEAGTTCELDTCGNAVCGSTETCSTCSTDCGTCPQITLTFPIGGETFTAGDITVVNWNSQGLTGNVSIYLSEDDGFTWPYPIILETEDDGEFFWTVPALPTLPCNTCRLKVESLVEEASDSNTFPFTILPP
jgi:hypothetical protein